MLICSSCVGIRGGLLPELDRGEVLRGTRLPAISFELDPPDALDPYPRSENWNLFCSAFVDARRGPAAGDLHVRIKTCAKEDHHALSIGLRSLCIFSLGLIPAYAQARELMEVRVELHGRVLREYHYEDRIVVWAHLLLLPWGYTNHNASRVLQDIHGNMLLHLIRDMRQDLPQLVQDR